jgi:hypothetical protein
MRSSRRRTGEEDRRPEGTPPGISSDAGDALYAPSEEELQILAADVRSPVEHGDRRQIKALFQAYVKEVRVASRDEIFPSFYIPAVRPPSYSVELGGLEPPDLLRAIYRKGASTSRR